MIRYVAAFLFLVTCLVYSQNATLKGRVVDSKTGDPLFLANVSIKNSTIGTSTDAKGEFSLPVKFTNSDVITVSYLGYKDAHYNYSDLKNIGDVLFKLEPKVLSSQTILVEGAIGSSGVTPLTFAKLEKAEIQKSHIAEDIPEILSYLPSTTFYSEGGMGLGYNYLSIRGFGQRRISVSINGIPQNEPEDHNIYWLDMPDIASSTELIQVQRGAGSGVIGYPAIGGSINLITSNFSEKPAMKLSTAFGDYNTKKFSASMASGLVNKKYSFFFRLSKTQSSGYRDKNWIDFNYYHLSAVRYDDKLTTQFNVYGGLVADGLTYNGLPKWAIDDKDVRKENLSYWSDEDGAFTYKTVRRPEEIENFSQPHFELMNEYQVNDNVKINSALFLVIGDGFFDYDGSWANYSYFRLTPENGFNINGDPDNLYMSNVLIRAKVENTQWGWIPRASIKHKNGNMIIGAEFRTHSSVHWGSINYAEQLPAGVPKEFRYYYYEGGKDIFNVFAHEEYQLDKNVNVLAELQLAYHNYKIKNEKYLDNEFEKDDFFVNPRVGFNYQASNEFSSYFSFARVTREPRLKTYYDAAESSGGSVPQFAVDNNGSFDFSKPLVEPEKMNSFEFGAVYNTKSTSLNLNLYYMSFFDEIVNQGQLDRFGQPITGNVDQTIHMGVEASATVKLNDYISIIANGTYSNNYVKEGTSFVSYYNTGNDSYEVAEIDLADNSISGFPDLIFNGIVDFTYKGLNARIMAKYVGEFYTDNYGDKLDEYINKYQGIADYNDNVVDSYFLVNFVGSYQIKDIMGFSSLRIFGKVNNLTDALYASYGIGKEFFPGAERNFIVGLEAGL